MFKLHNILRRTIGVRCFSTGAENGVALENLSSSRSLIRIRGEQVEPFLQGLITNDINHIGKEGTQSCMFSMFLNKGGRVLFDTIIYRTNEKDAFLIECDRNVDTKLRQHLKMFRVRKKIDIDSISDLSVWVAFTPNAVQAATVDLPTTEEIACHLDPRLKVLGTRLIVSSTSNEADISKISTEHKFIAGNRSYAEHRYRFGVGEGVIELPPEKCFPFEANCDYMHGVSFHKGCYLGQELTARTYHTGVIRKRLMPLALSVESLADVPNDAPITTDSGQAVGKLRGHSGKWAIGLLRVEQALQSGSLNVNGSTATTSRPEWWPSEAPKHQTKWLC